MSCESGAYVKQEEKITVKIFYLQIKTKAPTNEDEIEIKKIIGLKKFFALILNKGNINSLTRRSRNYKAGMKNQSSEIVRIASVSFLNLYKNNV